MCQGEVRVLVLRMCILLHQPILRKVQQINDVLYPSYLLKPKQYQGSIQQKNRQSYIAFEAVGPGHLTRGAADRSRVRQRQTRTFRAVEQTAAIKLSWAHGAAVGTSRNERRPCGSSCKQG